MSGRLTGTMATAVAASIAMTAAVSAEPRPRSTGIYAEAGIGGRGYLAEAGESSAVGPSASVHVGIDLFFWFSIGGRIEAATHEATVPPPPEGEYYQLYAASAEGRLGFPVGPLAVFIDGGVGVAMISTNVLEKVLILDPGERFTPRFTGGGGIEYQLQNRHYALGLAGEYTVLPAFDSAAAVGARAFLRYTY